MNNVQLEKINKKLDEIQTKISDKNSLKKRLASTEKMLEQERHNLNILYSILKKEKTDVDKLEGMSITKLFYTILNSKESQLDKERQEYLAAKLKFDRCKAGVEALEKDLYSIQSKLSTFKNVEQEYKELLIKKEELITNLGSTTSERLKNISSEIIKTSSNLREIQEAINAGKDVLRSLDTVINSLSSAKNWGTWDMFGGGMLSTAVKHSRIDEAKCEVHNVQYLLKRFEREVNDVAQIHLPDMSIDSFTRFADYFFDGLISDWIVQSKINDSLSKAQNVYSKVNNCIHSLCNEKTAKEGSLDTLQQQKQKIISTF